MVLSRNYITIACLSVLIIFLFYSGAFAESGGKGGGKSGGFTIASSAFSNMQVIPKQFTADGKNISPPLSFHGQPAATKSLALICSDPDAPMGIWDHWVFYNIPASAKGLEAAVPPNPVLADGARQALNSFGKPGYGGPEPPSGKLHHYHFKLYALDQASLKEVSNKSALLLAIRGHVLAECELIGTYRR
jgi:Raf kinase inhibitor-like YbhB/YbcL family protein